MSTPAELSLLPGLTSMFGHFSFLVNNQGTDELDCSTKKCLCTQNMMSQVWSSTRPYCSTCLYRC